MSLTYFQPIERGAFKPPSEEKVRWLARALGVDGDELCVLAGRVAKDLRPMLLRRPKMTWRLLRAFDKLDDYEAMLLVKRSVALAKKAARKKAGA